METFKIVAKTFMGLEPVLAKELAQMGAQDIQQGRRMVQFTGDKEMLYRANVELHTALKILKPIAEFKARSAEEVYDEVQKIDWSQYLSLDKTFAVDAVVFSEEFTHSKFVSYKVKDAIVDQFREKTGQRPNISVSNPDLQLHIHIADTDATLCLDSSGESLHRRGYRQESVEAPLNEVLAAGIVMLTGWQGDCDFIDPMCGSGTLLIEAALIARNMAPGLFRKEFAFEKWPDFDADLFDRIYNDDSREREFHHHIYGYDIDMKAVNSARINVKAAGLSDIISVAQQDFKDFEKPKDKCILVTNPPYGERITTSNLFETYRMIGERLKHALTGCEAWLLSYREECFQQIGLRPSIKTPLYNGSLECELRKYVMFDGKLNIFREEGGVVKTEEEKAQMAEKHRFKKHREFKQRLEEQQQNEEADIRSFTFHQHSLGRFSRNEDERRPFRRDGEERRTFRRDDDGRRPFRRGDDERPGFRRDGGGRPGFRHGVDDGERRDFKGGANGFKGGRDFSKGGFSKGGRDFQKGGFSKGGGFGKGGNFPKGGGRKDFGQRRRGQ
jgi:putative N6-adenine-specific DNA methylase